MGCHALGYMRYNRMGRDIGLSDEQLLANLMFVHDFSKELRGEPEKVGEQMKIAMQPRDAARWFGIKVPDLSVVARSRGADWLYSYLRAFHVDDSRPFGTNNSVFKDVGMPHVLWELEGLKQPLYETVQDADGQESRTVVGYEYVQAGKMSPVEYDGAVRDLVNFLVYVGEPAKLQRYTIGLWVMLFLIIFAFLAYALKKEYWRDIH
jgi:ubiquinol-cytochrome c reductase cytochrome c1 subunit